MELAQRLNVNLAFDPDVVEKLKPGRGRLPVVRLPSLESGQQIQTSISSSGQATLAATFSPILFDHGVRMNHDPHLIRLAKEPMLRLQMQEGMKRGLQDGDTVRVSANGSAIMAKVNFDERVAQGTIVLPLGFEQKIPVHELGTYLMNGLQVEIDREALKENS